MSDWITSKTATAKEALRLAFDAGKHNLCTFDQWYARVERELDVGQYLVLQKLGAVYALIEKAAHDDLIDGEKL